ncbi:MAG TPA: glycosyltransferase family 39 protein, partial [Abditibacteriaceae bacterium]|nr:glycosyltransferase family 39 protein [Abditibacteriaceae bacterium]
MHYLSAVATFLILLPALAVLGWWCADDKRTKLENTLLPGATFLGMGALLQWLCGLTIGLRFEVWPLLFLLFLFVIPPRAKLADRRRHVAEHARAWLGVLRSLRGVERVLVFYLFVVWALTFVLTLAPPNGLDYDSLMYHLAAPAQYLRAGRISDLAYDHHTYFPFTMEMLYLLGLKLQGPVLAKLFHWLMLPLSCLALIAMAERHLSRRAGLFAAALLASLPVVQAEASTAYIDLGLTAFVLLAFLCFANWLATREDQWLMWSGVFCGFCLGTKYLGALTFGWLFLWAVGSMMTTRRLAIKPLTIFVVVALALGGGWYARNWHATGNPVFPFAYEIFGGRGWNLAMAQAYTADQAKFGFGRSFTDVLWLPWRLAMTPLNFGRPFWPLSNVPVNNGTLGVFEVPVADVLIQTVIGPALLACGAPLVLMRRKPPIIGFVLWSFVFCFAFWAVTGQYLRYLLPPFALLCLACGWGLEKYLARSALLKWTAALALTAWLVFTPALTLWNARGNLPVIMGRQTPDAYLSRIF